MKLNKQETSETLREIAGAIKYGLLVGLMVFLSIITVLTLVNIYFGNV